MGTKKLVGAAALVLAGTLALSACGSSTKSLSNSSSGGSGSSSLTIGWNQYAYSLNQFTSFGNNVTNANVAYLTQGAYTYYDNKLVLQKDTSFGSYQKTSDSPLTIKETLSDKAKWSDGQPVVNADSILYYGAVSGLFNTVSDPSNLYNNDGTIKANGGSSVYFDSSDPNLALITAFPSGAANDKTLTYTFSKPFGEWEKDLLQPVLPAHIVGKLALGISDPSAANDAIVKAFQTKDKATLAKISNAWNSTYNMTSMPSNKDLLVCDGPYQITNWVDKQYITFGLNPQYTGDHKPSVGQLTLRFQEDATGQLQALKNGEVSIIEPQATSDLLKSAQADSNLGVISGDEASYEHVDLSFSNGGPFDPKAYGGNAQKALLVREAFLHTIPRQQIVDTLIKPLNPNATVRNSFNITPGAPNYDETVAAVGMKAGYSSPNIALAKQLLTQAGVKTPINVRFLYSKSNVRRHQEYTLIAESAKAAGFNVIDSGNPNWSQLLGKGSYDAALFAWQATSTAISGTFAQYMTNGQNDFGHYSNTKVDNLLNTLMLTSDPAKQTSLNEQVEKQLVADAFGTVIFQFPDMTVYNKTKVDNVSVSALTPTFMWNFWQWQTK